MWENFEARLDENEREQPLPLRGALFDMLRGSGMRPGGGVTKKMVSFEFGAGECLLWEIQTPVNIFLHVKWRDRVEANGFASELRPYQSGIKDGGRHSALSRTGPLAMLIALSFGSMTSRPCVDCFGSC